MIMMVKGLEEDGFAMRWMKWGWMGHEWMIMIGSFEIDNNFNGVKWWYGIVWKGIKCFGEEN